MLEEDLGIALPSGSAGNLRPEFALELGRELLPRFRSDRMASFEEPAYRGQLLWSDAADVPRLGPLGHPRGAGCRPGLRSEHVADHRRSGDHVADPLVLRTCEDGPHPHDVCGWEQVHEPYEVPYEARFETD